LNGSAVSLVVVDNGDSGSTTRGKLTIKMLFLFFFAKFHEISRLFVIAISQKEKICLKIKIA
jgi:hypothetical protein